MPNVLLVLVIFAVFAAVALLGFANHVEKKARAATKAKAEVGAGVVAAPYDWSFDYEGRDDFVEYCVSCGGATQYKKMDSVDFRKNYIDGAGQLCDSCAQEILGS